MARILFTWELGGGLGHLTEFKPLARGLAERGHKVYAALKDLSRARPVLGPGIALLQAPFKHRAPDQNLLTPPTFAHILHNVGYEHVHELGTLVGAWRGLFALTRPDLIVADPPSPPSSGLPHPTRRFRAMGNGKSAMGNPKNFRNFTNRSYSRVSYNPAWPYAPSSLNGGEAVAL